MYHINLKCKNPGFTGLTVSGVLKGLLPLINTVKLCLLYRMWPIFRKHIQSEIPVSNRFPSFAQGSRREEFPRAAPQRRFEEGATY